MKATYTAENQTIVITFNDDGQLIDTLTIGDVSDADLAAACEANAAQIAGFSCALAW
jgi:hypothetical protein